MDVVKGIARGFVRKLTRSLGMDTGIGHGRVRVEVIGADGTVKDVREADNLYVTAGKDAVTARVGGVDATAAFDWIGVGTSTQAAAAGDTALITELNADGLIRAQDATPTQTTTSVANDTLSVNVSFSVTGTHTVGEIGLLNATFSGGDLLGRTVLSPTVAVVNTDTLNATYTFQQS